MSVTVYVIAITVITACIGIISYLVWKGMRGGGGSSVLTCFGNCSACLTEDGCAKSTGCKWSGGKCVGTIPPDPGSPSPATKGWTCTPGASGAPSTCVEGPCNAYGLTCWDSEDSCSRNCATNANYFYVNEVPGAPECDSAPAGVCKYGTNSGGTSVHPAGSQDPVASAPTCYTSDGGGYRKCIAAAVNDPKAPSWSTNITSLGKNLDIWTRAKQGGDRACPDPSCVASTDGKCCCPWIDTSECVPQPPPTTTGTTPFQLNSGCFVGKASCVAGVQSLPTPT